MTKATRKPIHELRNWDFFRATGEFLGTLSYTRQTIKAHFHGARIRGSKVTLMA